ncbi:MAG TPA: N,N-dimethylformamidase beta subunit family domain-containing protein, partial [Actinomycetota bacterium]|nr:N,N-dimethylformamidase beta subunit family domain-containing protein [Actinomycetota bacterium]
AAAVLVVLGVPGFVVVGQTPKARPHPPKPAPEGAGIGNANAPSSSPGFSFPTQTVTDTAGPLSGVGALGPGAPLAQWVIQENEKPGTRDWLLTDKSTHHEIEGYAGTVSVNEGGSVQLYISTTAPTYHVEAYRMGYYGGAQGRLVWTSPETPGKAQPSCPLTPGVNTIQCNWAASMTVQTTAADWPQGDYLFKLVASTGLQSYIPLTIRDDSSTAAYVIDNDVTTWQAYNLFDGYDLYQGPHGYASRSRIVTFDRPYALGTGSGDFLGNELHVVSLMESLGLDVSYSTDVDLDEQPSLLGNHKVFLSLGHDEYYSLAMRNGLEAALGKGVNLVFFGANAIYRHIRFQPSALGPDRMEIDYKDASEDPLNGKDNADVTPVAWRYPPNNQPESVIIGDYYQCNPVLADMVISDPSSWIFQGTGVKDGTHLTNLVGTEYDRFEPSVPGPRNVTILARSPLTCDHHADYSDMTYYTAASGSGVFATGTLNWVPDMVPTCTEANCPGPTVVRATENILLAFGSGPAGVAHPSAANWQATPVPKPTPTQTAHASAPGPQTGEGTGQ